MFERQRIVLSVIDIVFDDYFSLSYDNCNAL